jgi:hypothetical protein
MLQEIVSLFVIQINCFQKVKKLHVAYNSIFGRSISQCFFDRSV